MRRHFFVYLFVALNVLSCTQLVTKAAIKERADAEKLVKSAYPSEFQITIRGFQNDSHKKDLDYLKTAIPDVIYAILRPTENEYAGLNVLKYEPEFPKALDQLVLKTNSQFSNYTTNMMSILTQYKTLFATNTNTFVRAESNSNVILIVTNGIETNIVSTNIPHFNPELFVSFMTNEFPDLSNTLSLVPVTLNNMSRDTNISTNRLKFGLRIQGSYKVFSQRQGPNIVSIAMTAIKYSDEVKTNKYFIKAREDRINDILRKWLKPLRELIINRPNGDLQVDSTPADAHVYLDGTFIGKTPLLYPAVPKGEHHITLLKEDYRQQVLLATLVPDKMNVINTQIHAWKKGGVLHIQSKDTNAKAFLDSRFIGTPPLTLSNLILLKEHRLKVMPSISNLKPFYCNFVVRDALQNLTVSTKFFTYEGTSASVKKRAWLFATGAWGLTLGMIGWNIYSHSQREYYTDLNKVYGGYDNTVAVFSSMEKTSFTIGIGTTILAGYLTGYALSTEEVFLGFDYQPNQKVYASLSLRF